MQSQLAFLYHEHCVHSNTFLRFLYSLGAFNDCIHAIDAGVNILAEVHRNKNFNNSSPYNTNETPGSDSCKLRKAHTC